MSGNSLRKKVRTKLATDEYRSKTNGLSVFICVDLWQLKIVLSDSFSILLGNRTTCELSGWSQHPLRYSLSLPILDSASRPLPLELGALRSSPEARALNISVLCWPTMNQSCRPALAGPSLRQVASFVTHHGTFRCSPAFHAKFGKQKCRRWSTPIRRRLASTIKLRS